MCGRRRLAAPRPPVLDEPSSHLGCATQHRHDGPSPPESASWRRFPTPPGTVAHRDDRDNARAFERGELVPDIAVPILEAPSEIRSQSAGSGTTSVVSSDIRSQPAGSGTTPIETSDQRSKLLRLMPTSAGTSVSTHGNSRRPACRVRLTRPSGPRRASRTRRTTGSARTARARCSPVIGSRGPRTAAAPGGRCHRSRARPRRTPRTGR
jgi:hypothetical protein